MTAKRRRRGKRELKVEVFQRGGDPERPAQLEAIARACVAELFSTRMANTLRVRIEVRAGVPRDRRGDASFRNMYADRSRKVYKIRVQRDLPLERQAQTLGHELVHVKQFAEDRLRPRTRGSGFQKRSGWLFRAADSDKSEFFPWDAMMAWEDRPWEREAVEQGNSCGRRVFEAMRGRRCAA